MRLDEFSFIHPQHRENALQVLTKMIGNPEADLDALWDSVQQAFAGHYAAGTITYSRDGEPAEPGAAAEASFVTGLKTPNGEDIRARFEANRQPGRQPWFGLWFEVVQRPGFVLGDMYFPVFHDGLQFLGKVAELAIPEDWDYQDYNARIPYPILKTYLEHTYARVKEQDKLVRSADGKVLWNTGLIDVYFKEIYICAETDPEHPHTLLNAQPILEKNRIVMDDFRSVKPQIATYFHDLADVIFDPELEVITSDEHILEDNHDRLPEKYRDMPTSMVHMLLQEAVRQTRVMARRNYKLVVPHYYKGKICFLMPIYLSGQFSGQPDFALALERIHDTYRGNTILTLGMAYSNARLIAKPDPTWLNPKAIAGGDWSGDEAS